MSIININSLTFAHEGSYDYIFKDASFLIDTDWRLGLVGRNGRGKTTLLNLLLGKFDYKGSISCSVKFDYFPFDVPDKTQNTLDIILSIAPDCEFWTLQKELNLLDVNEDCLYRPFSTLSNGEQTKVLLATLFLKQNNFLLIDEPTNHLDIKARQTVSTYLNGKKSFILVSHDRAFLDNCIDHVISINKANIQVQRGNLTSFFTNKERQDSFEKAQNQRLTDEISRLKSAARRKADWSNNAEKGKFGTLDSGLKPDRGYVAKRAAKVMKTAKVIEQRQDLAIEQKTRLLKNIEDTPPLKFNPQRHYAQRLVDIKDLSILYKNQAIFSGLNLTLSQGDRICVFGKNGCGKTSLLRLILGEGIDFKGQIVRAPNLKISYVCQDTSDLRGSLKQFALNNAIDQTLFNSILAKLDFSKIQLEKDIGNYSAGQKKKVLLAKSLSEQAHLYVWDEPLNYIDIASRVQIEDAIKNYAPTMLFVEHDKAFVDSVATEIIQI